MAVFVITGGAGFIGSHLVDRVLETGHEARVVDNFSTGKRENLAAHNGHSKLHVVKGDILQRDLMMELCKGADYVLHQAAIPSVPRSIEDPWSTHKANVEGTLVVLDAARHCGVKRVVFASSSSVYGDIEGASEETPKRESFPPAPLSPYAASKLAGEGYCKAFFESYDLETVALRYFNIFGPRQDPGSPYASVIPRFAKALMGGQRPVIYGDGHQTRDFTYVENVVEANFLACESSDAAGKVINIACGNSVSVLKLLETMNEIVGSSVQPRFDPPRPGDVRHSRADISLARELLGYTPRVSFQEGIQRTLEAMGCQPHGVGG